MGWGEAAYLRKQVTPVRKQLLKTQVERKGMELVLDGTRGRRATPWRENMLGACHQCGVPFQMGVCAGEGEKTPFHVLPWK